MAQHWPDFRGTYVEPLLRHVDKGLMGPCELAVVMANSLDVWSDTPVESSGWLHSVAEVRGQEGDLMGHDWAWQPHEHCTVWGVHIRQPKGWHWVANGGCGSRGQGVGCRV